MIRSLSSHRRRAEGLPPLPSAPPLSRSARSVNRTEYTMPDTVRTLFKGGTVVTMDAKVPNLVTGDVLVEGDRIMAVEANIRVDGAEVINAAGNIVLPG